MTDGERRFLQTKHLAPAARLIHPEIGPRTRMNALVPAEPPGPVATGK
jgi:hypothetical protein